MNLSTMESFMSLQMRSNASDFTSNRKGWINEVQRKACLLEKWDFTEAEEIFSTTLSVYTLGSKFSRLSVWRTTGANAPLELLLIDVASATLLPASGAPTHFRSPALNQVAFHPAPDVAYTFRVAGNKFLTDFVLAGDETELSIVAPYVLIFGALIEASIHLGRDPSLWKARFEEEMTILRGNHAQRGRGAG